jgi:fucose permease
MSEEKKPLTEEQKQNNRYSFVVGIVIGLVIIIIFVLLFH